MYGEQQMVFWLKLLYVGFFLNYNHNLCPVKPVKTPVKTPAKKTPVKPKKTPAKTSTLFTLKTVKTVIILYFVKT